MTQALTRRLGQLYAGLVLYGFSMALLVRARLGVMPWDVLHQGIARSVGGSLGTVSIVVGALVLLLWVPLRQRHPQDRKSTRLNSSHTATSRMPSSA